MSSALPTSSTRRGTTWSTAIRALFPFSPDVVTGPFGAGGVDWAFECTGNPAVLRAAIEILEWGGTAVAVGVPSQGTEVGVPVNPMVHLDRTLMGVRYGEARPRRDIPMIVDMYRDGRFKLDEMVSQVYELPDWERALHDLESGALAARRHPDLLRAVVGALRSCGRGREGAETGVSGGGGAAVEVDGLAGHPGGLVGREVGAGGADVFG